MASEIEIRKTLETVAKDAIAAAALWPADPPMQAANVKFNDAGVDLYWRPTLSSNRERPATMGPNPRVARKGFFKVGVFAREGTGTDQLDKLAQVIKDAYPYDSDIDVGGVKVQIDNREMGDLLTPPGWAYRPVDIYWSIGI